MSLADDEEFARAMIRQTMDIVDKEVSKIRDTLKKEKKARKKMEQKCAKLEEEVKTMKAGDCQTQAKAVVFEALAAAMLSISPPLQDIQPVIPERQTEAISEAQQEETPPVTKKKRVTEATVQILKEIEDLPEDLQELIKPFFKEDRQANHDMMNDVQRAFVKFKAQQAEKAGDSITRILVQRTILEGIDERIWTADFKPSETSDLETYLLNRLKNEIKALKRRRALSSRHDMTESRVGSLLESLE